MRKKTSLRRGVRISEHVYLLNALGIVGVPLPACYTYAIDAGESVVLVDPGLRETVHRVRANLAGFGLDQKPISHVILTHAHGDHVFAGKDFGEEGATLYASPYAADLLNRDIGMAFKEDLAYVREHIGSFPPIHSLADADVLSVGLFRFDVISTPGHTPGCLSVFLEVDGRRVVCSGDLIFPDGSIGHVGAKSFSAVDAIHSLRRLDALQVDILCGGHFYRDARAAEAVQNALHRAEDRFPDAAQETL